MARFLKSRRFGFLSPKFVALMPHPKAFSANEVPVVGRFKDIFKQSTDRHSALIDPSLDRYIDPRYVIDMKRDQLEGKTVSLEEARRQMGKVMADVLLDRIKP